ncbi:hypothetical protein AURDEDRAFT_60543 [Auricularia subglabra TFB-10046 SS5]|nr:hypothetical protein AURDEDRAFT_60543 [Auricularia subglabra TFB-10046 SS5]
MANELDWTKRSATRAAQKIPVGHEQACLESFLRQAISTRDFVVPAALRANIDQTMVIIQDGGKLTYNPKGLKQVSVVRIDEKRAFTVLVGVTAAGALLPFQIIMKGKTKQSIPKQTAPMWDEAMELGFEFVWSDTDTHWSTQQTMCQYVEKILVPHVLQVKATLNLPPDQECILQLDCWSAEFRSWMTASYPWIKLDYVPGGCTGIWQPCDVGIQRGLKHVIRRCQHADVVEETFHALEEGTAPEKIKLDTALPVLRQRSVKWLVQAYHEMNDPKIVQMVCFSLNMMRCD